MVSRYRLRCIHCRCDRPGSCEELRLYPCRTIRHRYWCRSFQYVGAAIQRRIGRSSKHQIAIRLLLILTTTGPSRGSRCSRGSSTARYYLRYHGFVLHRLRNQLHRRWIRKYQRRSYARRFLVDSHLHPVGPVDYSCSRHDCIYASESASLDEQGP